MNSILHIRSTIGMYGAEKVIQNLIKVSKNQEYKTRALIIEGTNESSCGLRVSLSKLSGDFDYIVSKNRFDFGVIKKIRLITGKNDIVHTHDYKSLILSSLALIFRGNKIVHHIHGNLGNTFSEKVYAVLESIFIRNVSKVITVSNEQKNTIIKKIGMKNRVIQVDNGTEIFDCKKYGKNESLIITMAARFTSEKNHRKAIDTINMLNAKNHKIELNLLGDGPELDHIEKYVNELGLNGVVKFLGFSTNVKKWLDQSDIMLITSITEGLPMCMLEAMACGLPILSTPVGEIPSILEKSNGGWIANDASDLYKVIESIIGDKECLKTSGEKAYDYARNNLSIEHQLECIHRVYEDISGMRYEYRSL